MVDTKRSASLPPLRGGGSIVWGGGDKKEASEHTVAWARWLQQIFGSRVEVLSARLDKRVEGLLQWGGGKLTKMVQRSDGLVIG